MYVLAFGLGFISAKIVHLFNEELTLELTCVAVSAIPSLFCGTSWICSASFK